MSDELLSTIDTGIFGGSFNPPHLAHLIVAETVREAADLERVLWIPSARPPHKEREAVASARHRYAMTERAIEGNDAFAISDVEMQREGPSYTVETVRILREQEPERRFGLIIGGDSLADFLSWHRPLEIVEQVPLIVYRRPGSDAEPPPEIAGRVAFVDAPLLEVSGTEIRERTQAGRSVRYRVPEAVRRYIESYRLYTE